MIWSQPEPEHLQVLLQHTKAQRELHQSISFAAETEMYREWLAKTSLKGHRGLFRRLKKEEQAFQGPFQQLPRQERMEKMQQWSEIRPHRRCRGVALGHGLYRKYRKYYSVS